MKIYTQNTTNPNAAPSGSVKCVKRPRRESNGLPCVILAQTGTQTSDDLDLPFAKILIPTNPANLVNLVKIFQNSKFEFQNSLKIENSLFEIDVLPILPILTFLPMSAPSGRVNCVKCPRREKQANAGV